MRAVILSIKDGWHDMTRQGEMFADFAGVGDVERTTERIYMARQQDERDRAAFAQNYKDYKDMLTEYENLNKAMMTTDPGSDLYSEQSARVLELKQNLEDLKLEIKGYSYA